MQDKPEHILSSGIIRKLYGIEVLTLDTASGKQYYYEFWYCIPGCFSYSCGGPEECRRWSLSISLRKMLTVYRIYACQSKQEKSLYYDSWQPNFSYSKTSKRKSGRQSSKSLSTAVQEAHCLCIAQKIFIITLIVNKFHLLPYNLCVYFWLSEYTSRI